MTDDDVAKLKLPAASGVVVDEVTRDSPAATAGLKTGDVIVEFDGEKVRGTRHLTRLIQETPAGRKVQASVMRDGQRVPLTVQPEASGTGVVRSFDVPDVARIWAMPAPPAPPAPPAAPAPPASPVPPRPAPLRRRRGFFEFDELLGRGIGRLGVTVQELQPQLAEYFGVREGVLVTSVSSGSTAEKAGRQGGRRDHHPERGERSRRRQTCGGGRCGSTTARS